MKRSGYADLPLHYGRVPKWLAERMSKLGGAIIECLVEDYGRSEVLRRLSDPLWFQALGCVLGMDWHSSGITTSVMGALKSAVNPVSKQLGLYFCGGRGKHSRKTPDELLAVAEDTGLDGNYLARCSRLSAKIDSTAVQDGFQIYLHSFIVTDEGDWAVVQQGLNDATGLARRYHWHSPTITSFVEEPHAFIYGKNQGQIMNLVDRKADKTRSGVLRISAENPDKIIPEIKRIVLPSHHEITGSDVDLRRLGSVLALAYERQFSDLESLILLEGLGPRTMQSLVLVSEIIHGTPSRFSDPARFSFAHGGKDGHPFPVPTKVYDETIEFLRNSLQRSKIGYHDKKRAFKNLSKAREFVEMSFSPEAHLLELIEKERGESPEHGGRTVFGAAEKPEGKKGHGSTDEQLTLF
jgi:hypothetical protein